MPATTADQIHEAHDSNARACPFCHSNDTRSISSIYDIAKNYTRSSIGRVAVTGGAGFYLDGGNVRPTPETILAAKFPPPKKPKFSWWLFSGITLTAAFLVFVLVEWVGTPRWPAYIAGVLCVATDYAIQRLALRMKMAKYRQSYDEWKQNRVCLDCERSFTPKDSVS